MQSPNGRYLPNLDHLRGLAALMVFAWHATHHVGGCARVCLGIDWDHVVPPLVLFEEGHTGVSLFMCISGFVFAHLTGGARFDYRRFARNRLLRLAPLMTACVVALALAWWARDGLAGVLASTPRDWRRELVPPGAWSIAIEVQYYALLPLIGFAVRRFGLCAFVAMIAAFVALRIGLVAVGVEAQTAGYWTIAGRADQFLAGALAGTWYARRAAPPTRVAHAWMLASGLALVVVAYVALNAMGGFRASPQHPAGTATWIALPLVEAIGYTLAIVGYLGFAMPPVFARPAAALGRWSYSIYMTHFHVIFWLWPLAAAWIAPPEAFAARLAWAVVFFLPPVVALSALTYRWIERPFLTRRVAYVQREVPAPAVEGVGASRAA